MVLLVEHSLDGKCNHRLNLNADLMTPIAYWILKVEVDNPHLVFGKNVVDKQSWKCLAFRNIQSKLFWETFIFFKVLKIRTIFFCKSGVS